MVLDAVSNFVRGTADAAVGTDDTTVSVADASIFPDPATDGEFNVVIWDADNFPRPDQDGDVEILRVTERDTDANELTVTRGQEMTSAASHPEGSAIHLSPTAKMFSDIESTFGDFWDAGTQELTADVNNTNTTTTALEAESVSTEEANIGQSFALAVADDATIEDGVTEQIPLSAFEENPLGASIDDNKLIVPSSGDYLIKQSARIFGLTTNDNAFQVRLRTFRNSTRISNHIGSSVVDNNIMLAESQTRSFNDGDEITFEVLQESGSDGSVRNAAGETYISLVRIG